MKNRTRNTLLLVSILAVAILCIRAFAATQLPPVNPDVLAQWQLRMKH